MSKWKDLGTLLLEYGLINADELKKGLAHQEKNSLRLGEALVDLGLISSEDIDWILSKQLDVPFVIVEDVTINNELLRKFQREFLIDNRVLPLYETDELISIVIEDPFNKSAVDFIRETFDKSVSISTGSGRKIEELLRRTFRMVGIPDLVDALQNAIEKVKDSSFYRMDFMMDENSCTISVFGAGIMKELSSVKGRFVNDDIFRSFDELGITFLYEQSFGSMRRFLFVYPLINEINIEKLPALIGRFGLFKPGVTVFADAHVHGNAHAFPLGKPVYGYPYLQTRKGHAGYDKSIYTLDSVPAQFEGLHVDVLVPRQCYSCSGTGCGNCGELGYTSEKVEGFYSYSELKEILSED